MLPSQLHCSARMQGSLVPSTNLLDQVKILKFQLYVLWGMWKKEEKVLLKGTLG